MNSPSLRAVGLALGAAAALLTGCSDGTLESPPPAETDAATRDVSASDTATFDVPLRDATSLPDAPAAIDRPRTDAPVAVNCQMPPPAYVVQDGRCVPSCLAAGGNTCSASLCEGRTAIDSYDCPTCCALPPSNCGGIPSQWVCTSDGRARQRCASGAIQTEMCAGSCIPGSPTVNATCGSATSMCTGSASGNSPVWTCATDHRARQRCVSGMTQTEACANGCVENPVGVDDSCASAPMGCTGSASGTTAIWTCTADGRSRQRCVSSMVQTEACASGCVARPLGTDDVCATTGAMSCTGSASGSSPIWTCTSDGRARQRCVSSALQTESCMYGCSPMPTGTDDVCAPMPTPGMGPGTVQCSLPQWWNLAYSWDPGMYSVRYGWDNDLRMVAGTGVQLRHASRLLAEGVYGWGWMPEFEDTVTHDHFRFLHLQPSRRLTTAIGTTYPAGTLVGYSGGNTADTGYPTYSTGAHLCVQTQVAYRTAFPVGMEPCR